jgi:hypothetical protein
MDRRSENAPVIGLIIARRQRTPGTDRADRTTKQAIVVNAVTDCDPIDRFVIGKLAAALLTLHPLRITICAETA